VCLETYVLVPGFFAAMYGYGDQFGSYGADLPSLTKLIFETYLYSAIIPAVGLIALFYLAIALWRDWIFIKFAFATTVAGFTVSIAWLGIILIALYLPVYKAGQFGAACVQIAYWTSKTNQRLAGDAVSQLNRPKKALEAVPVSDIRVTRTFRTEEPLWIAMVEDGLLREHTVIVGDYLGRDYGRVTEIDSEGVDIIEVEQNDAGDWNEKPLKLKIRAN